MRPELLANNILRRVVLGTRMGFSELLQHSAQIFYEPFSGNEGLPFFVKETASSFLTKTRLPRKI